MVKSQILVSGFTTSIPIRTQTRDAQSPFTYIVMKQTVVPTIFPKQALNITSIIIAQERLSSLKVVNLVFKLLDTKIKWQEKTKSKVLYPLRQHPRKETSLGITVPPTKAPQRDGFQ